MSLRYYFYNTKPQTLQRPKTIMCVSVLGDTWLSSLSTLRDRNQCPSICCTGTCDNTGSRLSGTGRRPRGGAAGLGALTPADFRANSGVSALCSTVLDTDTGEPTTCSFLQRSCCEKGDAPQNETWIFSLASQKARSVCGPVTRSVLHWWSSNLTRAKVLHALSNTNSSWMLLLLNYFVVIFAPNLLSPTW